MKMDTSEKYGFEGEWYDKVASTLKKFKLYFFPSNNSVEIFDLKTKKTFLRRTKCEKIEAKDFYIGATVTIFARNIKITNFADKATEEKLLTQIIRTFILVKKDAVNKLEIILNLISNHDYHISNIKMGKIDRDSAIEIFKLNENSDDLINSITQNTSIALEILKKNGSDLTQLYAAFEQNSITDIYTPNVKDISNCFFFPKNGIKIMHTSAKFDNCTCCIIKPHAVQAELISPIITDIKKANFNITAIQQFYIDVFKAQEFLEVYKGVFRDYHEMVSELQSGPCIVMEITHPDEKVEVVLEFRKLCGPMDPEIAKQLRPNTLRAKYGKTKVQNAVHCSDLKEDGLLEVEYFFQILNN